MTKVLLAVAGTSLLTMGAYLSAQTPSPSTMPSNADILSILKQRIDDDHQSVGIVVGIIEPQGQRIVSYGALAKGDVRPLNGDTVFEIGSITKVFTSLILTDAVERREVALTDTVAKYLPASVKMPERGGHSITLQDLSTHTSGLPRLPTNMTPRDAANPYADYSVEQLYQFLSGYQLTRDTGAQYEYSNLGGGLLGHVLARRAGMDYETLVRSRVTGPLGMRSTSIGLLPAMAARFAVGHSPTLQPVANWDLPTLAGAGALRSSASDLLMFLAAALGYTNTPLGPAIAAMTTVRRPTGVPGLEVALGWHVFTANGKEIIWHNGGTAGYRTFMGYDPKTRVGVVVLSNAGTLAGPDDIGRHLLDPQSPLLAQGAPQLTPPKTHTETAVATQVFDRYVGRYQLAPSLLMTITRDGQHFYTQLTGQPRLEIFAEGEKDYFLKIVDAQITFETDGQGRATAAVLHQMGRDQRAARIEGEPITPKEIALDLTKFDGYVGRYQLTPAITMTITRDDTHFFTQLTGQPRLEIFASSEREFFLKVVNAQITFETDNQGRAIAAILHQNGRDQRATRIE